MADSPDKADPPPRKKKHRWIRRIALLLVMVILLSILALSTGHPQAWLIRQAIQATLGAQAAFELNSTLNTTALKNVQLSDNPDTRPLLTIEQLKAKYRYFPKDGRYIERFHLMRPEIYWDRTIPNDAFIFDLLNAPDSDFDPIPFIPEDIALHHAGFTHVFSGGSVQVGGIMFEANTLPWESARARLWSEDFFLSWQSNEGTARQEFNGSLDIAGIRNPNGIEGAAAISLPGLLNLKNQWGLSEQEGISRCTLHLEEFLLEEPPGLKDISSTFGLPLSFKHISIQEGSEITGTLKPQLHLTTLDLNVHIEALRVGPEEAPWYQGNLDMLARQAQEGFELECTPHAGPLLPLTLSGLPRSPIIALSPTNWKINELYTLLPDTFHPYLNPLKNLSEIELSGDASRQPEKWCASVKISPAFRSGHHQKIDLALDYGLLNQDPVLTGSVTLTEDMEKLSGQFNYSPLNKLNLEADFQSISTEHTLHAWLPGIFPTDIKSMLSGSLKLTATENGLYTGSTEIDCDAIFLYEIPMPLEVPLEFSVRYDLDPAQKLVTINEIKADSEMMIALSSHNGSYHWDSGAGNLHLEGMLDLGVVTPLADLDELWGEVNVDLPVSWKTYPDLHLKPFTLEFTSLGYGGLSLPYGESLWLKGRGSTTLLPFALQLPSLQAIFGEGTEATFDTLELRLAPETNDPVMKVNGLSLSSDLKPLVQKYYLESVKGTLALEAQNVAWQEETLSFESTLDLKIEQAALPEAMGHTEEFQMSGKFDYQGGLQGSGTLTATLLEIYGIVATDISGNLLAKEKMLILEKLRASLYDGSLRGRAAVHFLETDPLLSYTTRLKDVDLEQLGYAFEPEETLLTGTLNGTIDATATIKNLQKLDINLYSSENFSINRELLEYLLALSQEQFVGIEQLDKAIQNVLGDVVQCPFDRASMKLGLVDGRITGTVRMESATLDLTIDIHADPKALLSALKSTR